MMPPFLGAAIFFEAVEDAGASAGAALSTLTVGFDSSLALEVSALAVAVLAGLAKAGFFSTGTGAGAAAGAGRLP